MKAVCFVLLALLASLQEKRIFPTCLAFVPTHPNALSRSTPAPSTRLFSSSAPDDTAIQEAYARWRQKYSKGEFSPERYENFKANFVAVTARNNMERARAKQTGAMAPAPIKLNQYGDCSADEYSRLMQGNQSNTNMQSNNNYNTINNGMRPSTPGSGASSSMPSPGSFGRRQEMVNNASSNLRAAMQQRTGVDNEVGRIQASLVEKQRLLQEAMAEEQFCKDRIALREEQKRILNDRLRNGWDDER